jgi:hypothetical protein
MNNSTRLSHIFVAPASSAVADQSSLAHSTLQALLAKVNMLEEGHLKLSSQVNDLLYLKAYCEDIENVQDQTFDYDLLLQEVRSRSEAIVSVAEKASSFQVPGKIR